MFIILVNSGLENNNKRVMRKRHTTNTKLALAGYYHEQCNFRRVNSHFDNKLHRKIQLKNVVFATAEENGIIPAYCNDCHISDNNFKIAAYSFLNDELIIMILDGRGCIEKTPLIELSWYPLVQ